MNHHGAHWWGLAGYARYKLTDKFATAYRAEFFRDESLFRAGTTGDPAFANDAVFEQSLTADYHLSSNLIARAEFRHDKANDDGVFPGLHSSQTSLGGQLIYVI